MIVGAPFVREYNYIKLPLENIPLTSDDRSIVVNDEFALRIDENLKKMDKSGSKDISPLIKVSRRSRPKNKEHGAVKIGGLIPRFPSRDKDVTTLMHASLESQIACAAVDSIGLCIFGRFVTNPNIDFLADTINAALGTELDPTFFHKIGRETLLLEQQFNKAAGFTSEDDDLPEFFYDEALPPTNQAARFRGEDIQDMYQQLDQVGTQGIPDEYGRV